MHKFEGPKFPPITGNSTNAVYKQSIPFDGHCQKEKKIVSIEAIDLKACDDFDGL